MTSMDFVAFDLGASNGRTIGLSQIYWTQDSGKGSRMSWYELIGCVGRCWRQLVCWKPVR